MGSNMPADLTETTMEASSVDLAPSAGRALILVVILPNGQVEEHELTPDATLPLGRSAGVAIRIDDPSVSRFHAEITVGPAGPIVRDLGSRNGTWVNEERIGASFVGVLPGDTFRFGNVAGTIHRVKQGHQPRRRV